jgi:septation ring formation regulator EzrA
MSEPTVADLIAELGEQVPEEVRDIQDAVSDLRACSDYAFLKEANYAEERIDTAILALLKVLCEQRTHIAELEADKEAMRDIITSQTNIVTKLYDQITDLRRAVTKWQWIAREVTATFEWECESVDALLADFADAYDEKEQEQ